MSGLHLDNPWYLLLWLPVVAHLWWSSRRPRLSTFRHPRLKTLAAAQPVWARALFALPEWVRGAALFVLIFAMARPQAIDTEVLSGEGVDVMIAVDMSTSMIAVDATPEEVQAALDKGERPRNRFDVALSILTNFVKNRTEDRVGLVVFGQEAFLKFPLTLDYSRILSILDGLVLDNGLRSAQGGECTNGCTISGAGTAIGDALARAFQRLKGSEAKSKIIALVTDGDNQGGTVQPQTIADYVASRPENEKVRIFTFLVGNDRQTFVPELTPFGETTYRLRQRPFPTNPQLLADIADKTGGKFYEAYDEEAFRAAFAELEKTSFSTTTRTQNRDVFAPVLACGLFLLVSELFLRTAVLRKFP